MRTSPRQKLVAEERVAKQFLDVIDSTAFERGSELAMLQFIENLPDTADPAVAAAGYARIIGAREFLAQLKSIAEPAMPNAPRPTYALNHDLK